MAEKLISGRLSRILEGTPTEICYTDGNGNKLRRRVMSDMLKPLGPSKKLGEDQDIYCQNCDKYLSDKREEIMVNRLNGGTYCPRNWEDDSNSCIFSAQEGPVIANYALVRVVQDGIREGIVVNFGHLER